MCTGALGGLTLSYCVPFSAQLMLVLCQASQRRGRGECVRVHWYTMVKESGNAVSDPGSGKYTQDAVKRMKLKHR